MTRNKLANKDSSAGGSLTARLEETVAVNSMDSMIGEASREAHGKRQHTGTGQRETQTI